MLATWWFATAETTSDVVLNSTARCSSVCPFVAHVRRRDACTMTQWPDLVLPSDSWVFLFVSVSSFIFLFSVACARSS